MFQTDVSHLTPQQLKERCRGCLEQTEGEICFHLKEIKSNDTIQNSDTDAQAQSSHRKQDDENVAGQ
jgi:hypothetical protein